MAKLVWSKWDKHNCKSAHIDGKELHWFCDIIRDPRNGTLELQFLHEVSPWMQVTMGTHKLPKMLKHAEACFKEHCKTTKTEYELLFPQKPRKGAK